MKFYYHIHCISVYILCIYLCFMYKQTKNQFLLLKNICAGFSPFAPPGHSPPFSTPVCAWRGGSPWTVLAGFLALWFLDGFGQRQIPAGDGRMGHRSVVVVLSPIAQGWRGVSGGTGSSSPGTVALLGCTVSSGLPYPSHALINNCFIQVSSVNIPSVPCWDPN